MHHAGVVASQCQCAPSPQHHEVEGHSCHLNVMEGRRGGGSVGMSSCGSVSVGSASNRTLNIADLAVQLHYEWVIWSLKEQRDIKCM